METWPQGSRGLALWLRPSPSTVFPGRAPRAAGWSPLDYTQVMWPGTQSVCAHGPQQTHLAVPLCLLIWAAGRRQENCSA